VIGETQGHQDHRESSGLRGRTDRRGLRECGVLMDPRVHLVNRVQLDYQEPVVQWEIQATQDLLVMLDLMVNSGPLGLLEFKGQMGLLERLVSRDQMVRRALGVPMGHQVNEVPPETQDLKGVQDPRVSTG